jgi:branched-chain amino acid transport system substrate-binding protein
VRAATGVYVMLAALTIAGCAVGPVGEQHVVGVVKLGADLPLSGDDAPDGIPVKNAVELAVKKVGLICGAASHTDACVTLQLVTYDDVIKGIHDPAQGAKNIRLLVADDRSVGVIGPLYDSLARSELPAASRAGLAMISPANTDECLTQEPADGHCQGLAARLRPGAGNNYFRVVTTQLVEGLAGADLAYQTLARRRAFVLTDQTAFGLASATHFADRFSKDGGMVVNATDLGALPFSPASSPGSSIERAARLGADVIYFAGSDAQAAAAVRAEMGARMPDVPLIGTDRLANSLFAKLAGAHARGSYYTVVGAYPPRIGRASAFLAEYRTAYGQSASGLSLQAFDATSLLIDAIARAIDAAGGTRPSRGQVLAEVRRTKDYRGLMGTMSFDGRGDTTLKLVTVFRWMAPLEPMGQFVTQMTVR